MSDSAFTVNASVSHKGETAFLEYNASLKLVAQLQGVQGKALELLDTMGKTIIDKADAGTIFNAAFPLPKKARKLSLLEPLEVNQEDMLSASLRDVAARHEYNTDRISKHHDALHELYEWYNDTHTGTADTVYQAVNTVADYLDHVQAGGGRAESAVFGLRASAKGRAFTAGANLCNN